MKGVEFWEPRRQRGTGNPSRTRSPGQAGGARPPTDPALPTGCLVGMRWAGLLVDWVGRSQEEHPALTPPQTSQDRRGDRAQAIIYAPPPVLYGLFNSAPATINVVNAEIISIFWRQAVIYSSHFSGGGSHAVKSSALPIKC